MEGSTRLEWLLWEMDINKIINRPQNHKSSLILMLSILQWQHSPYALRRTFIGLIVVSKTMEKVEHAVGWLYLLVKIFSRAIHTSTPV